MFEISKYHLNKKLMINLNMVNHFNLWQVKRHSAKKKTKVIFLT